MRLDKHVNIYFIFVLTLKISKKLRGSSIKIEISSKMMIYF